MIKNAIILEIESNRNLKSLAKSRDRHGDLWQNVLMYYLEMNEQKLINIYNAGYLFQHCNLLITRSSLNYHDFDKHNNKQVYIDDISFDAPDEVEYSFTRDELEYTLNHLLNQESTYDRELINLVYRGVEMPNGEYKKFRNLKHISDETGISYYTLRSSLSAIKKRLNEKIKHITCKG